MIAVRELTVPGVLKACVSWLPVNLPVEIAIAAHRIAFAKYQAEGEDARQVAAYTLRAVILARTPNIEAHREQLDYLSALPLEAWSAWRPSVRDDTLAAITRSISMLQLN